MPAVLAAALVPAAQGDPALQHIFHRDPWRESQRPEGDGLHRPFRPQRHLWQTLLKPGADQRQSAAASHRQHGINLLSLHAAAPSRRQHLLEQLIEEGDQLLLQQ